METVSNVIRQMSPSWLPQDFSLVWHAVVFVSLTYALMQVIQLFQKKRYQAKHLSSFPGPPTNWLYGNLDLMKPQEDLQNAVELTKKYPHCHSLWFGPFLGFLAINHPEYAKMVYSRGDPKSLMVYGFMIPWIGKGLLILSGPKWQQHRKLITPGFHYDVLKPYATSMVESAKQMLDILEKVVSKDPTASVEMFEYVSLMTLDTIMKCSFSYQSSCQTDRNNSYIQTVYNLSFLAIQRLKTPWLHNDLIFSLSPTGYKFYKACKEAHRHTDNIIQERKKSLKDEKELEKILKKRRLDFLDILLCAKDENGNPLSDEDLRAEVDTFMFEGHDTTASGISWLFYCMAHNPEHQEKCREEIKELLGDKEAIEWDDLAKLTYTTMCIKESLRLYPPVPQIARQLSSPVSFADGKTLPKDILIMLSIFSLHRNPVVWDNPEVYDPQRFSPENTKHRHPYAFLPFAAGPRNCIGQQFAMNEMKICLALTLLRFEILPDHSKIPIPIQQVVIRSKNGIYVKLKIIH